jgi:hypothetical protein
VAQNAPPFVRRCGELLTHGSPLYRSDSYQPLQSNLKPSFR